MNRGPMNRGPMNRGPFNRGHWAQSAAAALLGLVSALLGPIAAQANELVLEKSSVYNNIFLYKDGPFYKLTFGHNRRLYTETIYDTRDEMALPVTYTRFMTVALPYAAALDSVLEIGSGGGRTAWYLHKSFPKSAIHTVELDPEVAEIARDYFGIDESDPNFSLTIADGRRFMVRQLRRWDMVMVDAYRGPFVPFHLLTREFFELIQSRLKPGGVLVQNIEPTTMVFDAALATIQAVFDNVEIFPAGGNVVAIAYDGPRKTAAELANRAAELTDQASLKYDLGAMLTKRRLVTQTIDHDILTDDFAPVEALHSIERHNRKWSEISEAAE